MNRQPAVDPRRGRTLAAAAACAATLAIGVAAKLLFHSEIALAVLVLFTAFLCIPSAIRRRTRDRRWFVASTVIFGATGFVLVVAVLITPFGSYREWFGQLARGNGAATPAVSVLFVLVTTYFAALALPTVLSSGTLIACWSLALALGFLADVVFQSTLLAAALVIAATGLAVLLWSGRAPAARAVPVGAAEAGAAHGGAVAVAGDAAAASDGAGAHPAARALAARARARTPSAARASALLFVAAIAAVAALLSAGLSRIPSLPARHFVDWDVSPVLRRAVLAFDPQFPLLYDSERASRDFKEQELGGPPTLSSTPVFEVNGKAGQTVYLRTEVMDEYTGSAWMITPTALQSGLRYFGPPTQFFRMGRVVAQVKVLAPNIDVLPMTLETDRVIPNQSIPYIAEGNLNTGILLRRPIQRGTELLLTHIERGFPPLSPTMRAAYLQLPSELPQRVRQLAASLVQGSVGEEQKLKKIQDFLALNYTYSITASTRPKAGQDFVDSFLFDSSSGYCVHFASAFVVLARLAGIPARYATGYLAYIPSDSTQATVEELASHAWPEVWIEGRGWVTYEATPAVVPGSYHSVNGQWVYDYSIQADQSTARQLAGILGHQVDTASTTAPASGAAEGNRLPLWLAGAVLALLLAATALLLVVRGSRAKLSGDVRRRFYHALAKTVRSLERRYGLPRPELVGWIEWNRAAAGVLNGALDPVRRVTTIAIENLYAGRPLPQDALTATWLAARAAKRRMRSGALRSGAVGTSSTGGAPQSS